MTRLTSDSRRRFLKRSGFLALGFTIPLLDVHSQQAASADKPRLPGDLQVNRTLSAWIRIQSEEQSVLLMVGKVELGQGILTAVVQVCADELDVEMARVKVVSGDTALVPNEGTTAGSFSMPNCATAVRQAAAEVRAILLGLAQVRLGQPSSGLSVRDGLVQTVSGATISYWDLLVGESLQREATGQVKTKPIGEHRLVGRSVHRLDLTPKILGQAMFVQELRPKGMVFGQIVRPPTYGARLIAADIASVTRMPGVIKVLKDGSFLGVIATREGQAQAAALALQQTCQWQVPRELPGTDGMADWL
ncbi:MAG: molybdopterin-dependent oxidoreductase, partial [Burkholderiales bacterium]|nr:molybdopterin-dependent oxidoreductase [Burkholderiales bacterium]